MSGQTKFKLKCKSVSGSSYDALLAALVGWSFGHKCKRIPPFFSQKIEVKLPPLTVVKKLVMVFTNSKFKRHSYESLKN